MRVGFHYGRRYPAARRGVDHWPRHVPASSEHDVGLASAEDASARRRRSAREEERARELERRSPRKSGNGEGVELVARLRDDARFDPVRCPRERHADAAAAERFSDRQRRQHVAGGPAGRDQAPKLALFLHCCRRC